MDLCGLSKKRWIGYGLAALLFVALLLFPLAIAHSQSKVQPNRDVNWPSSCLPGQFYEPNGNLCGNGGSGGSGNYPVLTVSTYMGTTFIEQLAACIAALPTTTGGVCDGRGYSGTLTVDAGLTISKQNVVILWPCATISIPEPLQVNAGMRNVVFAGCGYQGGSTGSGGSGGTVLLYTGSVWPFIQVGDQTYAQDTKGFWLSNMQINTASGSGAGGYTQPFALAFWRVQEARVDSVYMIGDNGTDQMGIGLDGTGNYSGGTFIDVVLQGFNTGIYMTGHLSGSVQGDYANASTFVKTHINCATPSGSPTAGTTGIYAYKADGNTWTGGDVESCATMFRLGQYAENNTIIGLRNENSTLQYQADSGSTYNYVATGGTMFTGDLIDNGSRNSFWDTFHRTVNGMNGDWYASQKDATVTNHERLGTGQGNERGLLDEIQTDYGYRWEYGFTDGGSGEQFWNLLDMINNVNRISVGQYLTTTSGAVTNIIINNGGCYTTNVSPTLGFSGGGGGSGANAGTIIMGVNSSVSCNSGSGFQVTSVILSSGGSAYTTQPTLTWSGANQVTAPNAIAEIALVGSSNAQTAINSAATGGVIINGSVNAGTGGLVVASGGTTPTTVATIDGSGNETLQGNLTVNGTAKFINSTTIRNSADAEIDMTLWAGLATAQKESFIYKDWSGTSRWYLENDSGNNWHLNNATGGLDVIKAYDSANSGDLYLGTSNSTGAIRLNYQSGSSGVTNIYGGSSTALIAHFSNTSPKVQIPDIAFSNSGSASMPSTYTGTVVADGSGYFYQLNSNASSGWCQGSSGTATTCTITFDVQFTQDPRCVAEESDGLHAGLHSTAVTTAAATVTWTTPGAWYFNVICSGQGGIVKQSI